MEIPIPFRLLLFWKNIFKRRLNAPQIKISRDGRGVKSILFFLPEKKEDAKIAHYLIKTENNQLDFENIYKCGNAKIRVLKPDWL